jgi:hypothetical protein
MVLAGVGQGQTQLPLEPIRDRGQAVTPAYEGWFKNPDGTFSLLVGYFNRNRTEILDIPVGPNNRIEPGGPDRGATALRGRSSRTAKPMRFRSGCIPRTK